jgi:hypothetical protein
MISLVPGTLEIYKVRGSRGLSAGFTGYCGGLSARLLREESDLASTWLDIVMWTR